MTRNFLAVDAVVVDMVSVHVAAALSVVGCDDCMVVGQYQRTLIKGRTHHYHRNLLLALKALYYYYYTRSLYSL